MEQELPPAGVTLLQRLFSAYPGSMGLRLGGWSARLGGLAPRTPEFTLILKDPAALRRLLLGRDPLRFAEAYFTAEGGPGDASALLDEAATLATESSAHAVAGWVSEARANLTS